MDHSQDAFGCMGEILGENFSFKPGVAKVSFQSIALSVTCPLIVSFVSAFVKLSEPSRGWARWCNQNFFFSSSRNTEKVLSAFGK